MSDNSLLFKNLAILEKFQPQLAVRIHDRLKEKKPTEVDTFVACHSNNGTWYSGAGNTRFFQGNPEISKAGKYCAVFVGIGHPPYLFHQCRQLSKDMLSITILEPNIDLVILNLSLTSIYSFFGEACRISIIISNDKYLVGEGVDFNITPLGLFPALSASMIKHKGLYEVNGNLYDQILAQFWEEVRFRVEALGNSAEDTMLGIRHGALNMPAILSGVTAPLLLDMWKGRPVICVASGPSLKKNVDQLIGIEDQCLLVACDTSLLLLLNKGIIPHAVVTIERNLMYDVWMPSVLEKFPELCGKILLISQSISEPLVAGRWPGPKLIVGKMDSPADKWVVRDILQMNLLASGMCVAHMAMNFAISMEPEAVALIGQDLAFDEDGKTTHVDGAASATPDGIERENRFAKRDVEGINGGLIKTHQMWFYYLQIFERFLDGFNSKFVYQCSEGGAKIKGTIVMPLCQFLSTYLEKSNNQPKIQRPSTNHEWHPENQDSIDLGNIYEHAKKEIQKLDVCMEYTKKAQSLVDSAIDTSVSVETRKKQAMMVAELLDKIQTEHKALSFVGQSYVYAAGDALMECRFLNTKEEIDTWKMHHEELLATHVVCIDFLKDWLRYISRHTEPDIIYNILQFKKMNDSEVALKLAEFLDEFWNRDQCDPYSTIGLYISNLLCKLDFNILDEAELELMWKSAKFLSLQGRNYEAREIMAKAYSIYKGQEIDKETMAEFFLDWGIIEASNDLIRYPNFDLAISLLNCAASHSAEFENRVKTSKLKILGLRKSLNKEVEKLSKNHSYFYIQNCRDMAELALEEQNLPEAMEWIIKMLDTLPFYPEEILPNIAWLSKTALECRGATDQSIDRASNEALRVIWEHREVLQQLNFPWHGDWSEYLREHGYSIENN